MSLLGIILIVVLLLVVFGGLPQFGYYHGGYGLSGGVGLVLVIVLILVLLGRI